MALVNADRVWETSTTTGTGTYNLAGAVTAYRTFVAGVGTGNTCYYVAVDEDTDEWEIGLGTVTDATPDTLARTRIHASSNANAAVNWAAGTRQIFLSPVGAVAKNIAPPRGYLWDLTMSNAADATNDITVAAGEATDETGQVVMVLADAITKQIDAGWAVGTNAGGLNTGAVANDTWYEVHLIQRQDTGVVDVMFTTTANRATLPANYTHSRRIGWIRRGTATNLAFTQIGDYFTLTTQINDASFTATATAANITLTVPPNSIARFRASLNNNTTVTAGAVTTLAEIVEGNKTPDEATGHASIGANDIVGASAGHYELRVSATSQIEHDSDTTTYTVDIGTFGWIDDRLKEKN